MLAFLTKSPVGPLGNLKILSLYDNKIGDAGMTALAGAIASGSLGNLKILNLGANKIGDAGVAVKEHITGAGRNDVTVHPNPY